LFALGTSYRLVSAGLESLEAPGSAGTRRAPLGAPFGFNGRTGKAGTASSGRRRKRAPQDRTGSALTMPTPSSRLVAEIASASDVIARAVSDSGSLSTSG